MTMDAIKSYETLTDDQLQMIQRAVGSIQTMFLRLNEVDLTKGTGIIDEKTKCLWTKDGKRITLSLSYGAFCGSTSREADPDCPKNSSLQPENV